MRVHVARNLFDCELCVCGEGQLRQQLSNLRANQVRAQDLAGAGVCDELGPANALIWVSWQTIPILNEEPIADSMRHAQTSY